MNPRLLSLLLVTACSTTGPGDFDPPFAQTSMTLMLQTPDEAVSGFAFDVTGSRDVGGVEVPVVSLVDPRLGEANAAEALVSFEAGELVLGGFRQPDGGPGVGVDVQFNTPVVVDVAGPLGEPQTTTVQGTLVFGDPNVSDPGYLPFDMTFTPEEDGVVAPAPMGDVPGCRRTTFTASTTGGITVSGALWTKEAIGVVHAVLDAGAFGQFELGTEGWTGFDDVGGRRLIQAEQRLDATTPSFSLSTYDIDGDFVADKDTHAQMWLELRFADADLARTTARPQVSESFGTIFGVFPSMLVQTDLSVLHPEDADEGFTYWIAAVDEAAKNEPVNGIAYSVSAAWSGGEPVLAGAFIQYKRLE